MFTINENTTFISDDEFDNLPEEEKLKLIQPEIELIKKSFSKEQIDLLEADLIDGDSMTRCIYGMMAGDCNNVEVVNVIIQLPVLLSDVEHPTEILKDPLIKEGKLVNRPLSFLTPLEKYIAPNEVDHFDEEGYLNDDYVQFIENIVKQIKD